MKNSEKIMDVVEACVVGGALVFFFVVNAVPCVLGFLCSLGPGGCPGDLELLRTTITIVVPVVIALYWSLRRFLAKSNKKIDEDALVGRTDRAEMKSALANFDEVFAKYRNDAERRRAEMTSLLRDKDYIACSELTDAMRVAVAYALRNEKEGITSLKVFARTSSMYFACVQSLANNDFVDEIGESVRERLNLEDMEKRRLTNIKSVQILVPPQDVVIDCGIEERLPDWNSLQYVDESNVNSPVGSLLSEPVDIRFCEYVCANHYALINDKYVVLGLYHSVVPEIHEPKLRPFVYLNRRTRDKHIAEIYRTQFDATFKSSKMNPTDEVGQKKSDTVTSAK